MSDPFAYVPFAIAARGGTIDGVAIARCVMAGVTLLRRSATLVRALEGQRSAILLPPSAAFITALSASDGRAAVLVSPGVTSRDVGRQLGQLPVGAVFTVQALAARLPPGTPHVLLDEAPVRATVVSGGRSVDVMLTGHEALRLDGDPDTPGSDDPCIELPASGVALDPSPAIQSHRALLGDARTAILALEITAADRMLALVPFTEPPALTVAGLAPLLAGAGVLTLAESTPRSATVAFDPSSALAAIESAGVTIVAMTPDQVAAVLHALARRGSPLAAPRLRMATSVGAALPPAWRTQWATATGVELRPA